MKLIHCADIHLDSPMQTHMTAQQASVRNTEMLQSFVRLTEFAQEHAVRAVLIAGDLFDGARVRARTVDALLAAIRRTPEVDYLYLPGNHDEAANAFCDCALPGNLKLFGKTCCRTCGKRRHCTQRSSICFSGIQRILKEIRRKSHETGITGAAGSGNV